MGRRPPCVVPRRAQALRHIGMEGDAVEPEALSRQLHDVEPARRHHPLSLWPPWLLQPLPAQDAARLCRLDDVILS